jgi:hypothetical protein
MSISPSQLGAVVTRRTCILRAYAKISRYDLHDYFVIIALSNDALSSILLVGIDFFLAFLNLFMPPKLSRLT